MLLSAAAYSQPQVYNVQKYCVDQKPFRSGECDLSGNEYSFVFVDKNAKSVVFYFTDTKLSYSIAAVHLDFNGRTLYDLKGTAGASQMTINASQTAIELLDPQNHIYLTVGKSTKMQ